MTGKPMYDLHCPRCHHSIPPSEINYSEGVAGCGRCGEVFRYAPPATVRPKPAVSCPAGITVHSRAGELLITRRWFKPLVLIVLILFFPFFPIDIFVFVRVVPTLESSAQIGTCAVLLIPLILLYVGLALLINRTEVRVNRRQITIWHGPLPLIPQKVIDVTPIDQLYSVMEYHSGEHGRIYNYGVYMVLRGGKRVPLLTSLTDLAQAQFIEQTIEDHLGIADRPVVGEYNP